MDEGRLMDGGVPALHRDDVELAYYSLNRRVYRWFAPFYDLVAWPAAGLRGEVATLAGAAPGVRILDVATGTGEQALAFAARGADVVGVDLSPAMLEVARGKPHGPNLTFREGDGTELPFEDASFDASCVSFALHEMPEAIRAQVLAELARVTRPGGSVVVVDYGLPRNPLGRAIVIRAVELYEGEHYVTLVQSDLAALLARAGIRPRQTYSRLFGVAQIVVGERTAAASAPRVTAA